MALVMMSALLFTVLAVDTGRLMIEKRRLQKIADLSALYAVNICTCSGTETPDEAAVKQAAQLVASQNGYSGDLVAEAGAVTLGTTVTSDEGIREFAINPNQPVTAVRVVTKADYPSSLILPGIMMSSETQLQASAVAIKPIRAGLQIGSFLARLDTGDSILNPLLGGLLGTSVSLDLAGYKGIAATQVTLLNLIKAQAGVGTVTELLDLSLSVGEFLELLVSAVDEDSTASLALNDLSLLTLGPLPEIRIGDILMVTGSNPDSALEAKVNVFDLLTAGLQLANQKHAIETGIGIDLPGVLSSSLDLYVIEPPKIVIGPPGKDKKGNWFTETTTAQLRLQLNLALNIDLALAQVEGNLALYLDAAKAHAYLESVKCANASNPVHHVVVGVQPSLVSLGLGQYANIASGSVPNPTPTLNVKLLGASILEITLATATSAENYIPDELQYDVAKTPIPVPTPEELTKTVGIRTGEALANAVGTLIDNLEVDIKLLTLNLGGILDPIIEVVTLLLKPLLQGLLELVGDLVLDPLLAALGIRLGGADVSLIWLGINPTLLAI